MPIVTPKRRYVQHSSFSRTRYSNFADWLSQEGARLAATARSVRDKLQRIGPESPASVEAAADATPGDISLLTTGAVDGGAGTTVSSSVIGDSAATYASDGYVQGDTVEIVYAGTGYDAPLRFERVISAPVAETAMSVNPSIPDEAWPAGVTVTISRINSTGRE